MKHCIGCGLPVIADDGVNYRCPPCWGTFKAAGGTPLRDVTIVERAGIRVSNTTYSNHSLYCRECGKPLGMTRRVKFALQCGSECHTCDACAWKKKNAPPPSPSSDGLPK